MRGAGLTRLLSAAALAAPLLASSVATAAPVTHRADGTPLTAKEIDRTVSRLMKAAGVEGLALALIANSEPVYIKAYGLADVESRRPLTTRTVMYAASLTKAAFATMVLQLVDEKTIDLDTPIGRYLKKPLPEYLRYRDLAGDSRWKRITPRMLLAHTAGFQNWRFITDKSDFDPTGKLKIFFAPGSRFSYSGEGYALLQLVVEAVTGKSTGDLMQARIFGPLGMTRTSMTWRADFRIDFAHGYKPDGMMVGHHLWRKAGAAGSMDTTISDFAKFLAAVEGGALLSPRAQSEMLRPQVTIHTKTEFPVLRPEIPGQNADIALSYGLGWGLFRTPFGEAFFKEGHDEGTSNYALCLKDRGLCILMLSNDNRAEGIFKYMVDKLMGDVHLPWHWEGYVPYDRRKAP